MTREEKDLVLQDLCGRLPYGVKVTFAESSGKEDCILNSQHLNSTYAIEYLGLIPKGCAIAVTEGNNPYKK